MLCTKCGRKLSDTAAFCPICGTPCSPQMKSPASIGTLKGHKLHKKTGKTVLIVAIIAVFLIAAVIVTPIINDAVAGEDARTYHSGMRGTNLKLAQDGELQITRISNGSSSAPSDGIWTIFVYLCGADLESNKDGGGCATKDINEMVQATAECSELRFVIEAGGSHTWQNEICADGKNTRLIISDGKIETVEILTADMGDPDTLVDFLDWGLENYRSQYIMLDMWDHGGGSLMGVCFDERYANDSITLEELDVALSEVLGNREVKFDLIGCDACLMATVELANICVPFADYMVASEETEWGEGWDYSGFANGINTGAKEADLLGEYVCNAFYNSMNSYPDAQSTATLSVIDLSKLDEFLIAFNSYCADINNNMRDGKFDEVLQNVSRNMVRFNNGEHYTGDLFSFIKCTSTFSDKADRTLSMLNECVVYKKNGICYRDTGGLAIFYPFGASAPVTGNGGENGTDRYVQELVNSVKNICVTPYYLGIVDSIVYGRETMGNLIGYDTEQWIDDDSEYWSDNEVGGSEYDYWGSGLDNSLNTNMDEASVLFDIAPHVETKERESQDMVQGDSLGYEIFNGIMNFVGSFLSSEYNVYTFTLSDEGLQKVDSVFTYQFAVAKDSEGHLLNLDLGGMYLGSGDYFRDSNTRVFEQEFYGLTVGLPNGSPFSVHPISQQYIEGYGWVYMYYAPIELNGVLKELIFFEDYSANELAPQYTAVGVLDIRNDGAAARIEPLDAGDMITPLFPGYYDETAEFAGYYFFGTGEGYIVDTDGPFGLIWQAPLPNNDYLLGYQIKDIYGNSFYTPSAQCVVDINETWPYQMIK